MAPAQKEQHRPGASLLSFAPASTTTRTRRRRRADGSQSAPSHGRGPTAPRGTRAGRVLFFCFSMAGAIAETPRLRVEGRRSERTRIPRLLAEIAGLAGGYEVTHLVRGARQSGSHVAAVRSRRAAGAATYPSTDLRRRYEHSRLHLIHLLRDSPRSGYDKPSVESRPCAG